ELRGRDLARAELVLEAVDLDVAESAVGLAQLDEEQREAAAAVGVAFGARERERHLRRGRAREPLRAVEAPLIAVEARDRLGLRDVGAAGALGHPLAARPHL